MSERDTQRAILDLLLCKRILAFRMNTGAHVSESVGRDMKVSRRFVRYGTRGMADILAFVVVTDNCQMPCRRIIPTWIEVKSATGKQRPEQMAFQAIVETEGHCYIVARSVEDVEAALVHSVGV